MAHASSFVHHRNCVPTPLVINACAAPKLTRAKPMSIEHRIGRDEGGGIPSVAMQQLIPLRPAFAIPGGVREKYV